MYAQLGFCQGNYGNPVFTETFGVGTQDIALPSGTSIYTFANGSNPSEGFYTVSSNTNYYDWFDIQDHTRNDTNGRMLIVNSSLSEDEVYLRTITGLCENTTYEFSSWLINLTPENNSCDTGVIPVNIRFEIWDSTYNSMLAFGSTGDIYGASTPIWDQYALVFQTFQGQTSVRLKISANNSGGCGNDFAIDDIVFKSCSDDIVISDSNNNDGITLCSSQTPYSDTLTVTPDNTVFNSHFYQWQESTDGNIWADIVGETNASIVLPGITATTYYRAKVAELQSNLNISDCATLSDRYQIIVNDSPAPPIIECWETATFNSNNCSWIVTGTQPDPPTELECWESLSFNNTICEWGISGTQPEEPEDLLCWQFAVFNNTICEWEIEGTQPLDYRDEFVTLCEGNDVMLVATSIIENPQYQWTSGEMTQSITVANEGNYVVEVNNGCLTEIVTFIVTEIENPVIESIITQGSSIVVRLSNAGDYQYSLDGINYQNNNVFNSLPTGLYTIYIKSLECNPVITQEHFHFYIQKFMTPNDDGVNDFFDLNVSQFFTSSEVYIFNRYGKLLFSGINTNIKWDGTFSGKDLPTSDYWYRIVLDNQEFKGYFTLKR